MRSNECEPMNSSYPVPDPSCGICKEPVPYRLRRKCVSCKAWCHNACADSGISCSCIPSAAKIREVVADANLSGLSGEIVIAMLYLGPDDKKIASHMGVDFEEVAVMCQRLKDNGVWRDGKMDLGFDPSKAEEVIVGLALCACVAEGWVERSPA